MARRFGVVLALACFVSPSVAFAAGCNDYKDKMLVSQPFTEAATLLPKIEPKSEFETTAAYNARVAEAAKKAPRTLLIEREPNIQYLKYDADKGVLVVSTYAFSNEAFAWWSALSGYKDPAGKEVSYGGAIAAVVTQKQRVVGEYEATSKMGAKVSVANIDSETTAIFDRVRACKSYGCDSLFPKNKEPNPYKMGDSMKSVEHEGIIGRIPMTPDTAKAFKANAKLVFVVHPRPPYLISGTHRPFKTTVDNPRDITDRYEVMTGDIECGLVADRSGKVYGAYSTK
ncbi:hypothetical protein GBZ48_18205 [Azospirillum melinis]|uniref:Uncharacterized protein n=1 Tax=Azospirillum melinis TaxID=328839 RepID=A0ABX2KDG4_9PROT|nr:hypothetical protein [Azospirillum melinis]MBP2309682.1 hypothetical protein [Azospirillum melinis]NUB01204.1 hypothetical protein [Azospirillum melinis]